MGKKVDGEQLSLDFRVGASKKSSERTLTCSIQSNEKKKENVVNFLEIKKARRRKIIEQNMLHYGRCAD